MKLNVETTEVVLSNVGTTGEFRIRNSAKAFNILSAGLYGNKIKAIVRELGCNALDSHVAAGKVDIPFEVHLPTMLEPWFSVRDYGTGLSSDQVENIYTTYFESTKTDSNDFIGALGLGSKSPFSYTDNFTVTAIQSGRKCIFSAFINEAGVPSVAKMADELTDDPTGVEVKFSVTNQRDYYSFRNEAQEVFKWFKNKPTITGDSQYRHVDVQYKNKDILPGISEMTNCYGSFALMGNICYPLNDIPDVQTQFGKLAGLLRCNLLIEFDIGELDFAASREHLSYIPLTLNSIKKKLTELNDSLVRVLSEKADKIENLWLRSVFLKEESRSPLFAGAVPLYVQRTKFPLYDENKYSSRHELKLMIEDLMSRGLEISAFQSDRGSNHNLRKQTEVDHTSIMPGTTLPKTIEYQTVQVSNSVIFVLNDLKIGCNARARHHFSALTKKEHSNKLVYCLSSNKTDPIERKKVYDDYMKEIHNPPHIVMASSLEKKETDKTPMSKQGVMKIGVKSSRGIYWGSSPKDYRWFPITDPIDDKKQYYYCALQNYEPLSQDGKTLFDMVRLYQLMKASGLPAFEYLEVYGVRKSRIEELKTRKNWIWIEDKISEIVKKVNTRTIIDMIATTVLDEYNNRSYINGNVAKQLPIDSEYAKFVAKYGSVKSTSGDITALVELCSTYGNIVEVEKVKDEIKADKTMLENKYPLMKYFTRMGVSDAEAIEYIKLVDKQD